MSLTKGLLVVVIILLMVMVFTGQKSSSEAKPQVSAPFPETEVVESMHGSRCKCPKCSSPEKNATVENAEYFENCKGATEARSSMQSMCGDDDKFEYAVNDFGGPGMDYKDWVAAQAVDPQVMSNHAEFVKDRTKGASSTATGRTFTPDSHSSYDPISWQGLRRPQAVPICNPTQIPDVDFSLYDQKPKFTWSST